MRRMFIEGAGVPALLAVHQDRSGNAKEMALAYAKGIGCTDRRDRDHIQGRDRDRPVRRTDRTVRRRQRIDQS